MLSRRHLKKAVVAVIAALYPSGMVGGCGPWTGETGYSITVSGEEVGHATVIVEKSEDEASYSGTERRPFLTCDTTFDRKLTVSSDNKTLLGYYGELRVPGASYRTCISRGGDVPGTLSRCLKES